MKKIYKKNLGKIIGTAALLVFVGSIFYARNSTENLLKNDQGITVGLQIKGNPESEIIIRKYSDLQCPSCAAAYPVVDQILEEYGDDVRFEYHHFPLASIHPQAIPAAIAAEAAGQQEKFFEYHDILFDRQNEWSRSHTPAAQFISYARELGLDVGLFKKNLESKVLRNHVFAQLRNANQKGFTGTPTFTVNDERIPYNGFTSLESAIQPEIEKL